jgi:hypothetical protein
MFNRIINHIVTTNHLAYNTLNDVNYGMNKVYFHYLTTSMNLFTICI